MECTGGWPNAERGEHVYFGKPYAYIPLATVVRASDDRFNLNWDAINDASVTVATLDGETSSVIRNSRFPKSRRISLPSNAPPTDLLMNIETQKADVTFFDLFSAKQYIEKNPGKLKIVNYQKPVYLITLTPTLPQDDRFKQMIDLTIEQMLLSGEIESLLRKYEPSASMFLRVNDPYKTTLLP